MKEQLLKRMFFGFEVYAPWPEIFPEGKVLEPTQRHLTIAFLGQTNVEKLLSILFDSPPLSFNIGLAGEFDKCLLLPERSPHVVAWHVNWWDESLRLHYFQKEFTQWLVTEGFHVDVKENFLPMSHYAEILKTVKNGSNLSLKLP